VYYLCAFSRQILKDAVESGDVCLTVLQGGNEQLINEPADTQCEAVLKPPEDQVRYLCVLWDI
jgi:hypothetical protein